MSSQSFAMRAVRWLLSPLSGIFGKVAARIRKLYYKLRYSDPQPGTAPWLIAAEAKYGGVVRHVRRRKVSPRDTRSPEEVSRGGMIGGDRMLYHGYADKYAEYLLPWVEATRDRESGLTLVEVGILRGTGLAIWCDLFPTGRVIGLDIDLSHIGANMDNLKSLGAFQKNTPELYEFDQLVESSGYLDSLMEGDQINVCIDDGLHSEKSIITTMKSVVPHLADNFVYFVEDNADVYSKVRALFPDARVEAHGQLTVVSSGGPS